MANYSELKAAITAVIKANGNNEITGTILQSTLLTIVNSVGANSTFIGIAQPTTNPGTPDQNVFYIASTPGVYANFNSFELKQKLVLFANNTGQWVATELNVPLFREVLNNVSLKKGTTVAGYYINLSGNPTALSSLNYIKYDAKYIKKITIVGNADAGASSRTIAFFSSMDTISSATYLGGFTYYQNPPISINETVEIPVGTACIVVTDRLTGNLELINPELTIEGFTILDKQIEGYVSAVALDTETGTTWGYYIDGSGNAVVHANTGYTDFIPVTPSTLYRVDGFLYLTGGCMYNAAKTAIGQISLPNGGSTGTFTTLTTCTYIKLNVRPGTVYSFGIPDNFGKFTITGLQVPTDISAAIAALQVDNTQNKANIANIELNKADRSELSRKVDKRFEITSTFDNSSYTNSTYPFWPRTSVEAAFKFIQFNVKAKNKMEIGYIDIAGAYIDDTALNIGYGNLCVRIYSGVVITDNKSDFSNATLLRKSVKPIEEYFANSMKGATTAEILTRLQAGERGYTRFDFELLELQRDDVIYIYFGVDDDTIYTNTPNMATPTCRMSIVTGSNTTLSSSLFAANANSTFISSAAERVFLSPTNYPGVVLSSLQEITSGGHVGYIDIDSRDIYTFVGAMNTVLDALFAANPLARVVMIGHNTLSGRGVQGGEWFKKLVDIQQRVADYWGCYYLPLWQKLNWANNPPTNTFKSWCPDEIHPYSNPTKVSTSIGNMSIADYIIHDFVKEFLKPIFGDNWAGKKVATYGTSIPYGGKYTVLAANELGGTGFNYCSSGSYIRRGNTYQVNQANSFTNTDPESTYRNYQKDMLDLIGTANEPDLYVFDFGINDYNLDQTDFDVTED